MSDHGDAKERLGSTGQSNSSRRGSIDLAGTNTALPAAMEIDTVATIEDLSGKGRDPNAYPPSPPSGSSNGNTMSPVLLSPRSGEARIVRSRVGDRYQAEVLSLPRFLANEKESSGVVTKNSKDSGSTRSEVTRGLVPQELPCVEMECIWQPPETRVKLETSKDSASSPSASTEADTTSIYASISSLSTDALHDFLERAKLLHGLKPGDVVRILEESDADSELMTNDVAELTATGATASSTSLSSSQRSALSTSLLQSRSSFQWGVFLEEVSLKEDPSPSSISTTASSAGVPTPSSTVINIPAPSVSNLVSDIAGQKNQPRSLARVVFLHRSSKTRTVAIERIRGPYCEAKVLAHLQGKSREGNVVHLTKIYEWNSITSTCFRIYPL